MKLTFRQIEPFINSLPQDMRAVLIYGPNGGQIKQHAKTLGKQVVEDLNDPFNVCTLEHDAIMEDNSKFQDEAFAMSMLGGKRLIRIENAADGLNSLMADYLKAPNDECVVLLLSGDLGPNSSLRKLFEKEKNCAALPCYMQDERDVANIIQTLSRHAGYTLDQDAARLLSDALTGDSALIKSEMDKLILYKGQAEGYQGFDGDPVRERLGTITLDDVFACNPNMKHLSLDDFVNAAALGQTDRAQNILNKMSQEGVYGIVFLRSLMRHFRRLMGTRLKIEAGAGREEAIKALKPPLFFKQKPDFERQLSIWTSHKIDLALSRLIETEAKSKQSGYDPASLLSHLVLTLSRLSKM